MTEWLEIVALILVVFALVAAMAHALGARECASW